MARGTVQGCVDKGAGGGPNKKSLFSLSANGQGYCTSAQVAELADALDSGSSVPPKFSYISQ